MPPKWRPCGHHTTCSEGALASVLTQTRDSCSTTHRNAGQDLRLPLSGLALAQQKWRDPKETTTMMQDLSQPAKGMSCRLQCKSSQNDQPEGYASQVVVMMIRPCERPTRTSPEVSLCWGNSLALLWTFVRFWCQGAYGFIVTSAGFLVMNPPHCDGFVILHCFFN